MLAEAVRVHQACRMESGYKFLAIMPLVANAICVAACFAVGLYDLGFSSEQVRDGAVITATIMAALVAIDFFGKKLRKAK
jgi:hypothetical protein